MVKKVGELHGTYLFRSMTADGEWPAIGPTTRQLGPRVNAGDLSNIAIDDAGCVHAGEEGLSVTPADPRRRKEYRRPPEWGGKKSCPPVWCVSIDDLGNDLAFREDTSNPGNHGYIAPVRS
jgi:hypothetical protein